jgi:diacylglycerol kinase
MKRFVRSVAHALKGLFYTFRNERNFQVELAVTGVVLLLMLWLPLSVTEELILIVAIVLVLALELVNTAVERIMDILKPRVHPYARVVKDVMAGAVFVVSLGALLLGIVIFVPYFWV